VQEIIKVVLTKEITLKKCVSRTELKMAFRIWFDRVTNDFYLIDLQMRVEME